MRLTLIRLALAGLLLTLFAGDVLAGPIRDRIRARLSGASCPACQSCPGCQAAPSYVPAPAEPIDDRQISYDPRPAVAQAGALVTTSGRTLLPNGDGTYRYADERPAALPTSYAAPSSCPGGVCAPAAPRYVLPVQNCPGGRCPVPVK